jgi:hypothetical protein
MAYIDRFGISKETFSDAARSELRRLQKEDNVLSDLKFEMWVNRFYDNGTEIVLKDNFAKGKAHGIQKR